MMDVCRYSSKSKYLFKAIDDCIDDICLFGKRIAKGYLEYPSTTVSMYTLRVEDTNGPLKSMLRRSKG